MILRTLAVCSLALAALGCASAEFDDGGPGGAGSGTVGGPSGDGDGGASDPLFGGDDADELGTTGPATSTGTSESSGAGGAGGGPPDTGGCEGCCDGAVVVGTNVVYARVPSSNAFASPMLVDALLPDWSGQAPLPVRTHEFLNFYAPDVPGALGGIPVAEAGAMPLLSPSGETLFALQVAVRDFTAPGAPRSVALLVDTSPSLAPSVDVLLDALSGVALQLRPQDSLAIFSAARDEDSRVIRPFATVETRPLDEVEVDEAVRRALLDEQAEVSMQTALLDAVVRARQEASSRSLAAASVVLVTDGRGEVSDETLEVLRNAVTGTAGVPTRVVGIGVGAARSYASELLDRVTEAGGGASFFFDGSDLAATFLAEHSDQLFSIAYAQVRLELKLPIGVEIVKDNAPSAGTGSADAVVGRSLAAGGTMTFHHTLRWTGPGSFDACAGIGWDVRASATPNAPEQSLGSGALALGDVFAGEQDGLAVREGRAVLEAAAALQGPTPRRLQAAATTLRLAAEAIEADGAGFAGHKLGTLCEAVALACAKQSVACDACDPSNPPGAP